MRINDVAPLTPTVELPNIFNNLGLDAGFDVYTVDNRGYWLESGLSDQA